MWASGADVAKVATTARDITDARRMLALLEERSGTPSGYLHAPSRAVYTLSDRRDNIVLRRQRMLLGKARLAISTLYVIRRAHRVPPL